MVFGILFSDKPRCWYNHFRHVLFYPNPASDKNLRPKLSHVVGARVLDPRCRLGYLTGAAWLSGAKAKNNGGLSQRALQLWLSNPYLLLINGGFPPSQQRKSRIWGYSFLLFGAAFQSEVWIFVWLWLTNNEHLISDWKLKDQTSSICLSIIKCYMMHLSVIVSVDPSTSRYLTTTVTEKTALWWVFVNKHGDHLHNIYLFVCRCLSVCLSIYLSIYSLYLFIHTNKGYIYMIYAYIFTCPILSAVLLQHVAGRHEKSAAGTGGVCCAIGKE
jgi:hypothetical protein